MRFASPTLCGAESATLNSKALPEVQSLSSGGGTNSSEGSTMQSILCVVFGLILLAMLAVTSYASLAQVPQ